MSLATRVARNTAVQFGGKFLSIVLGFLTIALLQRALQVEGFGSYTIIVSYLGFFSVIADLGLYLILIRELNKPGADRDRVFANVLGIRLVTFGGVFVVALLVLPLFGYAAVVNHGVLVGVLGFLGVAVSQLLTSIFQSALTMQRVVVAELVGRLVLLGGVLGAVLLGWGVVAMVGVLVLANGANALLLIAQARPYVRIRVAFDRPYWGYLLRETAPVAISVVLNLIYFRIDTILLSVFRTTEEVGLYGASYKVLEILNTFPIMFVGLMLPLFTQAFALDHARFRALYQRAFDALFMGVLPLVVGGWLLAEPMLVFIGGSQYAPAAPIFQLLLIAVGFLYLNALSGHTITIIHKQRQMVWAYLAVALVGLAVYFSLIPAVGMRGAAIGTILTEALTAIIGAVVVFRTMRFVVSVRTVAKALVATAVMAGVLWLIPGQRLLVEVPVAIVVYAVGLLLTRSVPIAFLREVVKREQAGEAPPPATPS
ncbi:MAG: flippase [Candidatus Kerfeldbacteria bacterium]|nr:flippase [Candidatus Kerfeldbacteria bacterium]